MDIELRVNRVENLVGDAGVKAAQHRAKNPRQHFEVLVAAETNAETVGDRAGIIRILRV